MHQQDGGQARWQRLGSHSWGWLHPSPACRRWGYANAGLITDAAATVGLLFDTQFTAAMTTAQADALAARLPAVRIETVVASHANGDHTWGAHLFAPPAQMITSAATAAELACEMTPTRLADMIAAVPADTALGGWLREHFGGFDFTGAAVTPPSRTFSGHHHLSLGSTAVQLIEVGPAHTGGDVIAWVPDDGVVFAGDVLFIDAHPVAWAGSILHWPRACQAVLDTGATTIVPGHGPLTSPTGVAALRDYLHQVAGHATRTHDAGVPYWQAAAEMPLPAYATGWAHPERLVALTALAYAELDGVAPPSQADLLARMATAAADGRPSPH
jgi:glyoxylase-like metal-dependent hydrolase (beta-lactamase superfamily II)